MSLAVLLSLLADPISVDNYTLYSLRHPLYPVAQRDSQSDNFTVDITDQPSQILDLKEFMAYSDYLNLNETYTIPVNVTKVIEVVTETLPVDSEIVETAIPIVQEQIVDLAEATAEAIEQLEILIEATPVQNISNIIAWDALQDLINAFGLDEYIELEDVEEFVEQVEEIFNDPEAAISEFIGVDVGKVLDTILLTESEIVNVDVDLKYYVPAFDPLGPYMLYPEHCYP
jgi:hypothetical protein